MRHRLPLRLAAFFVLALAATAPAETLDPTQVARRVQARYDATESFTAAVVQSMRIESLDKTLTSRGTVAFKKPGRMRWEFTESERQLIIADGEMLWFYRPGEQQVFKAPFDRVFRSTTPISFLTGVGSIVADFTPSLDGESPDGKLLYLLLVPKQAGSDVGQLRLFIDREEADIRGAEVRDPLGNVSTLEFNNLRRNVRLDDDQFVFEVPKDVDIITSPFSQ